VTAPVRQAPKNEGWQIGFVMPSDYKIETLPTPEDDRFSLREEKEKTVAAIRYPGTWGKERYQDHEKKLMHWTAKKGLGNHRCAGVGAVQSTLCAVVDEKKTNIDSSKRPMSGLRVF
jgi:hypothetical protein